MQSTEEDTGKNLLLTEEDLICPTSTMDLQQCNAYSKDAVLKWREVSIRAQFNTMYKFDCHSSFEPTEEHPKLCLMGLLAL